MVDEQQDGGLLGAVIGIGREALRLERPAVVRRGKVGKLAGDTAPVYLADSVAARRSGLDGDAC